MAEEVFRQVIEPSEFDLIVVGTGMPESLVAAAAASAGKSVLHLDHSHFYGSQFASLPLEDFNSWLHSQTLNPTPLHHPLPPSYSDFVAINLETRTLYSEIEISSLTSEYLGPSRSFNLDLSGPRVIFCADSMVDLMVKSGASHHIEFKSVDASYIWLGQRLLPVPDSRAGIFKDKNLSLTEKRQLMQFFKLVQEHFDQTPENQSRISDEDLDSPFVEFLERQRLPSSIKSIILYAIAMASYDQENPGEPQNILKTRDGIQILSLYHSSVGRFPNAVGAFIYPIYGQGELPQAFCRCAAVKGAVYVLRMPVTALLIDKENRCYKGVRLETGQELFSHHLVLNPSFMVPPSISNLKSDLQQDGNEGSKLREVTIASSRATKVVRGVCIIKGSLQPELSTLLLFFPPRSLDSEQATPIRALQLGSNLAVCPSGLFVLYLATLCDDSLKGKEALHTAINALCMRPIFNNFEDGKPTKSEDLVREGKPLLLWVSVYAQELAEAWSNTISLCPSPDGSIDYKSLLESSMKLFSEIYPNEEIFPETPSSNNTMNDDALSD